MKISAILFSRAFQRMSQNLVQYIIVRKDVLKEHGLHFIMGEACLVCSAVHFACQEDPATQEYFKDVDNMHKVVLGVDNESQLLKLANDLKEKDFSFELRTNPEKNIPTCLAIKVYEKGEIAHMVKKFKLLR
ncbi:putative peptidyl-tRNA hydrolase PTRHD1 [Phlebotomus argentipes]|uniref:putative peptidyl-tRNA hydrolase PTRHD1 n=1 Tax=Phlebotomus argentipes TaxID=94469 RepID=UPI002892BDD1|nr:putative peptidyl-tRNA hydrolase PTRHD1 [Phlebotomus argentipes]